MKTKSMSKISFLTFNAGFMIVANVFLSFLPIFSYLHAYPAFNKYLIYRVSQSEALVYNIYKQKKLNCVMVNGDSSEKGIKINRSVCVTDVIMVNVLYLPFASSVVVYC